MTTTDILSVCMVTGPTKLGVRLICECRLYTVVYSIYTFLFQPKADWRAQHENFIKAIRYAKGASDEPPPPSENPDYVQCPHCERKFNAATAERHIPKCKDIKAKPSRLKKKR